MPFFFASAIRGATAIADTSAEQCVGIFKESRHQVVFSKSVAPPIGRAAVGRPAALSELAYCALASASWTGGSAGGETRSAPSGLPPDALFRRPGEGGDVTSPESERASELLRHPTSDAHKGVGGHGPPPIFSDLLSFCKDHCGGFDHSAQNPSANERIGAGPLEPDDGQDLRQEAPKPTPPPHQPWRWHAHSGSLFKVPRCAACTTRLVVAATMRRVACKTQCAERCFTWRARRRPGPRRDTEPRT